MRLGKNGRGFEVLNHTVYADAPEHESALVQQSSIIGSYSDAMERPGSSALWIGIEHHLNREEVQQLRDRLTVWLETGSLRMSSDEQ